MVSYLNSLVGKINNQEITFIETGGEIYVLFKNGSITETLNIVQQGIPEPFVLKEIRNVGAFTLCEINKA